MSFECFKSQIRSYIIDTTSTYSTEITAKNNEKIWKDLINNIIERIILNSQNEIVTTSAIEYIQGKLEEIRICTITGIQFIPDEMTKLKSKKFQNDKIKATTCIGFNVARSYCKLKKITWWKVKNSFSKIESQNVETFSLTHVPVGNTSIPGTPNEKISEHNKLVSYLPFSSSNSFSMFNNSNAYHPTNKVDWSCNTEVNYYRNSNNLPGRNDIICWENEYNSIKKDFLELYPLLKKNPKLREQFLVNLSKGNEEKYVFYLNLYNMISEKKHPTLNRKLNLRNRNNSHSKWSINASNNKKILNKSFQIYSREHN